MKILRSRKIAEAVRELRSRFIREPVIRSIRRVMDVCEKHGAKFTFFIVGVSAECNKEFIREIIDRGHEIGCHGFYHSSFDLLSDGEIREDLERCLDSFDKEFRYQLKGFRAPYLKYNSDIARVLSELGFVYSSSYRENEEGIGKNPIIECPISVDDWKILIKENRGQIGLYEEMIGHRDRNTTFLLHPWRVGQKRYVYALERFIAENGENISFPNMSDFVVSNKGIALSGDVGEMALTELIKRSIWGNR